MNTAPNTAVLGKCSMNTSRTYSSSAMAFPKHVDYACAVERHKAGYSPLWWTWMICIAIVGAVLVWVTR